MRVPQMVSDFFEWRWAPCVGLTAGSLAFVVLALLFIPTRVDEPLVATTPNTFDRPPPQRPLYGSSLARSLIEPAEPQLDDARVARSQPPSAPRSNETRPAPQRGFSPILDRPEPPAPPPAPVAPPQAPEPVPGSVVVIQPVPGGESREVTVQ
jgi:hypothetical protein